MTPFDKAIAAKKALKAKFPTLTVHISIRPTGLVLEVTLPRGTKTPKDLPKEIDGVPVTL